MDTYPVRFEFHCKDEELEFIYNVPHCLVAAEAEVAADASYVDHFISRDRNIYQSLKLVNGSNYKALDVIIDDAHPGHRISADTILYFGPPAGIILAAESTRDFNFVGMLPGTILLTPLSSKIECVRRHPWQQHDVTRRGLPCTAAFVCTDYKVQGRTLKRVALELKGTRTVHVFGQAVPSQCDSYSLYVQLSRSSSL